jgi:hypothetical protein
VVQVFRSLIVRSAAGELTEVVVGVTGERGIVDGGGQRLGFGEGGFGRVVVASTEMGHAEHPQPISDVVGNRS